MKTITFTCETITPMFLNGADGQTPELRPPAIKAALRYWWRALNGHMDLSQLKKEEAKIFGGSGEKDISRSTITVRIIQPIQPLKTIRTAMLPHREIEKGYGNPSEAKAFDEGQQFQVVLGIIDENKISLDTAKTLFELAVLLGGLGKRIRRGMGSMKIIAPNASPNNLEGIFSLIKKISPHFAIQGDAINNIFNGRTALYPWVKQIKIGSTVQRQPNSITVKVGKTASDLLRQNGELYEASLGHANRGRFASPVFVSVLEVSGGYTSVITTLNTVPDRGKDKIDFVVQEIFKNDIL